jgi:hypothetical protein
MVCRPASALDWLASVAEVLNFVFGRQGPNITCAMEKPGPPGSASESIAQ